MDPHQLSVAEAAALIRSKALSARELALSCLDRIEARESAVGAWAHLDRKLALRDAQAADDWQAAGHALGPLHGVPVGIKDIIDTAHYPTENGSPFFGGRRPESDASVVAQLTAAGAIVLGKTVTTELAFFGPGKTRNPHDLERTPGGSSSGSAAAVADFHVPLALGTQTAGSIVRPASYCGILGLKPTFGLVSRTGVLAQSPPLDTIGGYARTSEDMAMLIDAMSGIDASDKGQTARPQQRMLEGLREARGRPLRFAFIKTLAWPQGDGDMQRAFEDFVAQLRGDVFEVPMPALFNDTGGLQQAVQFFDIARNYGPLVDEKPHLFSDKLKEVIAAGRTVTADAHAAACARREPLYAALLQAVAEADVILTPAAQGVAPLGLASTGSPMFNFIWTYLGMPAISVPALTLEGLPLGVQVVGRRGEDHRVLQAAEELMARVAR